MSTKSVGPYSDVPCASSSTAVEWSPDGKSWGIARNKNIAAYDYVWASISSNNSSDCGAASGWCVGAARYDLSAGTVSRSFDQAWNSTSTAVVPDVAANYPDVVTVEKRASGTIVQWDASTGTSSSLSGYAHLSQLDWVNTDYFVATEAGTTTTTCGDSVQGNVVIGAVGSSSEVSSISVARPSGAPSNATTKPEGVSVADVRSGYSASCASGTTDIIYVVDFCQSQIIAYSIDTTDATPTPVEEDRVDLDSSSSFTGDCNPSSVVWHRGNNDLYVLCQTRNTIIRIDASSDQCDIAWTGEEALLQQYSAGADPSCTATPTIGDCTDCQPHNIAYDQYVSPGWLFVTLNPGGQGDEGQVLAIDDNDLASQFLVYLDDVGTNYAPLDLEILPSSPP